MLFERPQQIATILFTFWILYILFGILFNWFSSMEHRVAYDPLTHIYNRSYCDKILAEQTNVDTTIPICVAMLDIDHFKKVNDTHGHQAGDDILTNTAAIIKDHIPPKCTVCRYGGEEIIVFLPKSDLESSSKVLEEVRVAVKNSKVRVGRKMVGVTISIGLAERPSLSKSLSDVLSNADKSLYLAKKGGRDQVRAGKKQVGGKISTGKRGSARKPPTKKKSLNSSRKRIKKT